MQLARDHYLHVGFIMLIVLAKLLPHPPNVSPLTMIVFLLPSLYAKKTGFWYFLFCMILADCAYALLYQISLFGGWSLITYSGFAVIYLLGCFLDSKHLSYKKLVCVPIISLTYWTWTNIGVWYIYEYYANTLEGLIYCLVNALPFLVNAMVGDLVWAVLIFGGILLLQKPRMTQQGIAQQLLKPKNP